MRTWAIEYDIQTGKSKWIETYVFTNVRNVIARTENRIYFRDHEMFKYLKENNKLQTIIEKGMIEELLDLTSQLIYGQASQRIDEKLREIIDIEKIKSMIDRKWKYLSRGW
jgi:hypothetical protein